MRTSVLEFAFKVKDHSIPISLYVGKKDYVIKENFFDFFMKVHPKTDKIILDKRHHEMIDGYIQYDASLA